MTEFDPNTDVSPNGRKKALSGLLDLSALSSLFNAFDGDEKELDRTLLKIVAAAEKEDCEVTQPLASTSLQGAMTPGIRIPPYSRTMPMDGR